MTLADRWCDPLSACQRRRLFRKLDRAFWRAAFRPPRTAADAKYGDPGVLEDLDLAAGDLTRRRTLADRLLGILGM